MLYPCPACGFEVFDEPSGSYALCPLCDWEDDQVQLHFPGMSGGANQASLFESQRRTLCLFTSDVLLHSGYRRCPDWRPLRDEECGNFPGSPMNGREYLDAAASAEESKYYWRSLGDETG